MELQETDGTPDFSEVCLVGGDLTEFSAKRLGPCIRRIDLSFNVLLRVQGFEICADNLEELILDNNQLEQFELRTNFPKLHTLSLNKNRIWNLKKLIEDVKCRAKNLRYLSLLGNPMCPDQLSDDFVDESDYQVYRYHILFHLSSLRFLDHRQVAPHELNESQHISYADIRVCTLYTPLTPNRKKLLTGKDKGQHGKRRYKYIGKNSEGNRFIQDSDL